MILIIKNLNYINTADRLFSSSSHAAQFAAFFAFFFDDDSPYTSHRNSQYTTQIKDRNMAPYGIKQLGRNMLHRRYCCH